MSVLTAGQSINLNLTGTDLIVAVSSGIPVEVQQGQMTVQVVL